MLSVTVQLHNCFLLPNYSDEIVQEFHLFPFYPLVYQPEAPFILIQLFQMGGIHESIFSISHKRANCKCLLKKTQIENHMFLSLQFSYIDYKIYIAQNLYLCKIKIMVLYL